MNVRFAAFCCVAECSACLQFVVCAAAALSIMAACGSRSRRNASESVACKVCATLFFSLVVHCVSPTQAVPSLVPEGKQALLLIRQALAVFTVTLLPNQKSQLLPWDPGADPCQDYWVGVGCICAEECTVKSLNLSAANLRQQTLYGGLPDVFSQLQGLEVIDVSNQRLSGPVPESILTHPTLKRAFLQSNLFVGDILDSNVSLSASLEVLNVEYNMLSGPVDSRLCSLNNVMLAGNPSLCGPIPSCLGRNLQGGVLGTGLMAGLDFGRQCSAPTAQCTGVSLAVPQLIRARVGASDGSHCTIHLQGAILGTSNFNITFSPLENVDALVVRFTGVGILEFGGWFWMTRKMGSMLTTSDAPYQVCPPQQHFNHCKQ